MQSIFYNVAASTLLLREKLTVDVEESCFRLCPMLSSVLEHLMTFPVFVWATISVSQPPGYEGAELGVAE